LCRRLCRTAENGATVARMADTTPTPSGSKTDDLAVCFDCHHEWRSSTEPNRCPWCNSNGFDWPVEPFRASAT
jgi:rubrerythrin